MILKSSKGLSVPDELMLLLRESTLILLGEKRNLAISLLFPVAAGLITVWIGGENMFVTMESTRSACFILICAAIWCGLFNSIQVVVKERANIRRDYVSGALRLGSYMASRGIVQLVLCLLQSAMLVLSIPIIGSVYDNALPEEGLVFSSPLAEYYLTLALVMYASDAMGLMISCLVRSEQLASQLSPYILIAQLLFSGVLFEMKGAATGVSALMVSRWGMEGLGSISDLNAISSVIAQKVPQYATPFSESYEYTPEHLKKTWWILLVFCVVPLFVGDALLHRVSKDGRG